MLAFQEFIVNHESFPMSPPKDFASPATTAAPQAANIVVRIFPIVLAVFVSFMAIGIALPALPLHVHGSLGLGTLMVGVVAGAQFAAALLTRAWAGGLCDTRGSRRAVMTGFVLAVASALAYWLRSPWSRSRKPRLRC